MKDTVDKALKLKSLSEINLCGKGLIKCMALMPFVETSELVRVVPSKAFQLVKVIQKSEIKSTIPKGVSRFHLLTIKSKERHVGRELWVWQLAHRTDWNQIDKKLLSLHTKSH